MLGHGVVHPPGEAEPDYDGFYYRADEMQGLADNLVGKPLCIEHDTEAPVGKVKQAWVGRDNALNVVFETDKTFKGFMAENLLVRDVCKDLSLGHNVTIDRKNMRVLQKDPTEVSICVAGDRAGTHVQTIGAEFGGGHRTSSQYIRGTSSVPAADPIKAMSDTTAAPDTPMTPADDGGGATNTSGTAAAAETKPAEAEVPVNGSAFNQELLDMLAKQQTEVANLTAKYNAAEEKRKAAETKAAKLGATNKRKRADLIDNTVKKLVEHLLKSEEFRSTLAPQEKQIEQIMEGLKDSEDAAPLVDVVACAASAFNGATSKLEAEYQATKRLRTENSELKERIKNYQAPALATARERFGAPKAAPAAPPTAPQSQWRPTTRMPRGMKPLAAPKSGVQVANPEFWKQLVHGGTEAPSGMGWFQESNIVGKEYNAGQRPKNIERRA